MAVSTSRNSPRHLGISLGMIDSLSDGLGEFSTQICQRLVAMTDVWDASQVRLHLHMPKRWHGRFGNGVDYLDTHRRQGYLNWQGLTRFDVWHGLNQLGRIRPPPWTRHAVLTVHDLNAVYHDSPSQVRRTLGKLRARLRHFDEVATSSHYVEGDIRKHLHWAGPVSVIPLGARDLTTHAQLAVDDIAPGGYLLHLSRMAASKNVQSLIELAAVWPQQRFVLAGPPSTESDAFRQQAGTRGLGNVTVVQEVSDAQKTWLYANCQGFLFPSLTEGFGLPPLEAMHFGKPVYLSRLTSLPEVGGAWAAYFDSFDPHAMRRTIESEEPRLLATTSGIRSHAAGFSWDAAAAAYAQVYRRLLALP